MKFQWVKVVRLKCTPPMRVSLELSPGGKSLVARSSRKSNAPMMTWEVDWGSRTLEGTTFVRLHFESDMTTVHARKDTMASL